MVPVFVAMVFGRLGSVVLRLHVMPVSYVAVMAGFFVVTRMVVFSGRTMVFGRMFMVLSGFCVVFCALLAHRGVRLILNRGYRRNQRRQPAACQSLVRIS